MAWGNYAGAAPQTFGGGGFFDTPFINSNPFTQGIMSDLGNEMNWLKGGMSGAYGQMGNLIGAAAGANPNAWFNSFMAASPAFSALATDRGRAEESDLTRQTQKAASETAAQMSDLGAQYSGANFQAMNEAAMNTRQNWMNQILGRESNMLNNLYGTAMPQFGQAQQGQLQALLQGAGLYGQQGANMGNLFGQGMGIMGQMGDPMMQAGKSGWDYLMQGVGAAGGILGTLFPFGI